MPDTGKTNANVLVLMWFYIIATLPICRCIFPEVLMFFMKFVDMFKHCKFISSVKQLELQYLKHGYLEYNG
jgi:hypothetical protein